jgi:hypothetical protein
MKKIYTSIIIGVLSIIGVSAQNVVSNLPLTIYVEDLPQPFPLNAKVQIINKLNQMISANGYASTDIANDFILTVVATPTDKAIVPGAPPQIMQSLDFTFYIVDANRQIIFSTHTTSSKGVGPSETKSYMDAIKRVSIKSSEVSTFLNQGRNKIVAWYDNEAERIFAKAESLAAMHSYAEAFYNLCGFPTECKKYDECLKLGNKIYQDYVDHNAQISLNKAKMEWAAEQNSIGAERAGLYLADILPEASCYQEAMALYKEIKAKVLDDWKFEMKKYQDSVDLEKQRIESWKEVGVAYGKNQKPTTTNLAWLR